MPDKARGVLVEDFSVNILSVVVDLLSGGILILELLPLFGVHLRIAETISYTPDRSGFTKREQLQGLVRNSIADLARCR